MEMERCKYRAGKENRGVAPGFGPGASQSPCGLGLGDALYFPEKDLAGAVCVF